MAKVELLATAVAADPAALVVPNVNAGVVRTVSFGIGVTWMLKTSLRRSYLLKYRWCGVLRLPERLQSTL